MLGLADGPGCCVFVSSPRPRPGGVLSGKHFRLPTNDEPDRRTTKRGRIDEWAAAVEEEEAMAKARPNRRARGSHESSTVAKATEA